VIYDSDDDESVEDITPLSPDEMEVDGHHPKSHYWKNDKYDLDVVMSKANANKEEEDGYSEGVKFCEVKSDIKCSNWDKLTMLCFLWITVMGVACVCATSAYGALIQPHWDMIAIPFFILTSLGWDTLTYFVGPPSKPILPLRRVRRVRRAVS
jgi:hypothetical protein